MLKIIFVIDIVSFGLTGVRPPDWQAMATPQNEVAGKRECVVAVWAVNNYSDWRYM